MEQESKRNGALRIGRHPIVDVPEQPTITFSCDGKALTARRGDMIAAALLANGISAFRKTGRFHQPRGIFCGIGQCNDCVMIVDGVPNVRTCVTPVREGMAVRTQDGPGEFGQSHDL
jgi:predicted molibdopterin-dependent oxidoreductase YjgC